MRCSAMTHWLPFGPNVAPTTSEATRTGNQLARSSTMRGHWRTARARRHLQRGLDQLPNERSESIS